MALDENRIFIRSLNVIAYHSISERNILSTTEKLISQFKKEMENLTEVNLRIISQEQPF